MRKRLALLLLVVTTLLAGSLAGAAHAVPSPVVSCPDAGVCQAQFLWTGSMNCPIDHERKATLKAKTGANTPPYVLSSISNVRFMEAGDNERVLLTYDSFASDGKWHKIGPQFWTKTNIIVFAEFRINWLYSAQGYQRDVFIHFSDCVDQGTPA
jgi:hypothetical protein